MPRHPLESRPARKPSLRMRLKPRHLRVAAILAIGFALTGCVGTPTRFKCGLEGASGPYVRGIISKDGRSARGEVAIRKFRADDASLPEVYLVSAIHIADREFYTELNRFMHDVDLVLTEGVRLSSRPRLRATPPGRPDRPDHRDQDSSIIPADTAAERYSRAHRTSFRRFAAAAGLTLQSSYPFTYQNPLNSDVTREWILERYDAHGVDVEQEIDDTNENSERLEEAQNEIDRDLLEDLFRLCLIRICRETEHVESTDDGHDRVILEERNAYAMNVFRERIGTNKELGSVAFFYGAAHMPGLEHRLREDFGYSDVIEWWIPAVRTELNEHRRGTRRLLLSMLTN